MSEPEKSHYYVITEKTISLEGENQTVYGLAQFENINDEVTKLSQIDDISPKRSVVEYLLQTLADAENPENEPLDTCILEEIVEDFVQEMAMQK